MMLLFLPLLLVTAASAAQLIEHFECGSDPFSKRIAAGAISSCSEAVKDGTNLCCKHHDRCYELHSVRGYTRDYCDDRFCHCLQDLSDKAKSYECAEGHGALCSGVKTLGWGAFDRAKPTGHGNKFDDFVDYKPFGLEMKSLVDACYHSKGIAVHCHNSVVQCLAKEHERFRREEAEEEGIVEDSWKDCRSTMHDCLQTIAESEASENCTAAANSIAKQVNVYIDLDDGKYGRAIIDTYPIIAARLLNHCNQSTIALEPCFSSFDSCAKKSGKERPELYNTARKINIECHRELSVCVSAATNEETTEDCLEARALAVNRIRNKDLEKPRGYFGGMLGGLGGLGGIVPGKRGVDMERSTIN